ncbi:hypothetical protein C2W64_03282 [Brevibacillus laterosporus]|nr:hypothetical protein C2W64_03282 [Brevibacillus laterosporus]
MIHLMFTQAIFIIPFSENKQQLGVEIDEALFYSEEGFYLV